jgi:hypothetical protein
MSAIAVPRPQPDESAPFYHGYIAEVADEPLGEQLAQQLRETERLFQNVTDQDGLARYAEGKWSVKEVIGHLIDSERVFAYRLFRVGRGDATPLAGFDENAYVPAGKFDGRPLSTLLAEFRAVRSSTVALIEGLPAESWTRRGVANSQPISTRALAYIIVGHVAHHLRVLRGRYGL